MQRKPMKLTFENPKIGLQVGKVYFTLTYKVPTNWWKTIFGPHNIKKGIEFSQCEEEFPEEIRKAIKRRKFKL